MLPLLPGGSNWTHSLPSGQLPFAPDFLFLASVSLASWEGQGPEEKGLQTASQRLPSSVCIFMLPCPSLSWPPCQVSKPFPHQSKEWPLEGAKRVPSVAKGQFATGHFKILAPCDWSISLGKKLS